MAIRIVTLLFILFTNASLLAHAQTDEERRKQIEDIANVDDLINSIVEMRKQMQGMQVGPAMPNAMGIPLIQGMMNIQQAISLNNQAEELRDQGRYAEAEPLYKESLQMMKSIYGEQNPNVAVILNNLGVLYEKQARYDESESMHQQSLAIREKFFNIQPENVAISLNNLASLYDTQAKYTLAEPLYQRALKIWRNVLGIDHPNVATALNNLADLYGDIGQLDKALDYYQKAYEIRKKYFPDNSFEIAESKNNLATTYFQLGQFSKAERLFEESKKTFEEILGKNHLIVATILNNLAHIYQKDERINQVESLYFQLLDIRINALGKDHPEVATTRNNFGVFYFDQGKLDKAEQQYQHSLTIRKQVFQQDHPDIAQSLNNLAELYKLQGLYEKAESLSRESLEILKKTLGEDHPLVATNLFNIAISLWGQGKQNQIEQAVELFKRANQIRTHHLDILLTQGSEHEKHKYLATIQSDPDAIISLHQATTKADAVSQKASYLAMSIILQRKGRILDIMSTSMKTLRKRMNAEDAVLLDQLSRVNRERSQLYNTVLQSKITQEQYLNRKEQLEQQSKDIENKISKHSAEYFIQNQPISVEIVQQNLPENTALIEYVRYYPFDPIAKDSQQKKWGSARYIAYILKSSGKPIAVDLGEASKIENEIKQFRRTLANPNTKATLHLFSHDLEALIIQPIREYLEEIQTVLISPDAALNLIPFAALMDESNRYLLEDYHITYLSSGRDILRITEQNNIHITGQTNPAIFADIDYGPKYNRPRNESTKHVKSNVLRTDFGQMNFGSLPGTKDEAEAINQIIPTVRTFTGLEATESALKKLDSPQLLHLATHGFFLSNPNEVLLSSQTDITEFNKQNNILLEENPLLRSGIILAQANQNGSGDEDGILSALEVTGLDLWGTQLVVLSACDTGIGEIPNGKGVFGLRRALVIAGSETQVMSLWKVNDLATQELMVYYYTGLVDGKGRSEAMRQAQLLLLKHKNFAHPYYWASFIVSGNWESLVGIPFKKQT